MVLFIRHFFPPQLETFFCTEKNKKANKTTYYGTFTPKPMADSVFQIKTYQVGTKSQEIQKETFVLLLL